MENLEEKFKNLHRLPREERQAVTRELHRLKPKFMKGYAPSWWWWKRCKVKVLIVTDGGLNFGTSGFDFSEFLTAFNALEAQSSIDYEVTLAHRGTITNSLNSTVVNQINGFKFDSSVNLNDFDQLWMFGLSSGGSIAPLEIDAIETFMDGGGGVFATGDHGSLGRAMCGDIKRVKDMRYWNDFGNSEVGMSTRRRNDTNQPEPGSAISNFFDNQSDDRPQTIAVRTFGAGMPHPLLSIKPSLRPSRIIDIMPDHPHEGECKPETTFTENGVAVPTQIIATSFVRGGSTISNGFGKERTEPHCFPSIAVWDGWKANVGRIVVDSTWHHFVNINLNGEQSDQFIDDIPGLQSGLTTSDWYVICQYFMNIARWISRRKYWWCWRRKLIFELLNDSQLIEASLDDPLEKIAKVSLADINSIGALAEEILASKYNPGFARLFFLEIIEESNPQLAAQLDIWSPLESKKKNYYTDWINYDLLLYTAIGAGFLALRENNVFKDPNKVSDKSINKLDRSFIKGMDYGFKLALKDLEVNTRNIVKSLKRK